MDAPNPGFTAKNSFYVRSSSVSRVQVRAVDGTRATLTPRQSPFFTRYQGKDRVAGAEGTAE